MSNQLEKTNNNLSKQSHYNQELTDSFLQELIDGGQLPSYIKKVATAKTVAVMGRELGFSVMISFNYIIPIQGKLTLSAKAQTAILRRHGVKWRTIEDFYYCYPDGSVEERKIVKKDVDGNEMQPIDIRTVIEFERDGVKELVKYYYTDALAAGLVNKDNWIKYKKSMYWARCFTTGATRIASDLLLGLYGTDEIFDSMEFDENMVIRDEKGNIVQIVEDTDYKEAE